jgi:hypothetical protein
MKTLVLVLSRMTLAFFAESCQGDGTQEQKSLLNLQKIQSQYTRCGMIHASCCVLTQFACVRANAKEQELQSDAQLLPQFFRE